MTGEEEEEVACELKGAKVFIKRGERDFCEGILGHAKLLKHKATGAERICTSASHLSFPLVIAYGSWLIEPCSS